MPLVITRKEGEKICFLTNDGDIILTVMHYRGGRMKVLIDSPKNVKVLRADENGNLQTPAKIIKKLEKLLNNKDD